MKYNFDDVFNLLMDEILIEEVFSSAIITNHYFYLCALLV